jgi:hypothetical protein
MNRRTGYVLALLVLLAGVAVWFGTRPTATDKALKTGDDVLASVRVPAGFHADGRLSKADGEELTWFRAYRVDNPNATSALADYAKALADAGAIPAGPDICGSSLVCLSVYYPPHTYRYLILVQTGPDVVSGSGSYVTVNMSKR